MREAVQLTVDPTYRFQSLAIGPDEDDCQIRELYRPFLLPDAFAADDWVAHQELSTALKMVESQILDKQQDRLRILVLYGSLRSRWVPPLTSRCSTASSRSLNGALKLTAALVDPIRVCWRSRPPGYSFA